MHLEVRAETVSGEREVEVLGGGKKQQAKEGQMSIHIDTETSRCHNIR